MRPSLQNALNEVEITYDEISKISDDLLNEVFAPIVPVADAATRDINKISDNQVCDLMAKLSGFSFHLSDFKEKAISKATCSELVRKQGYSLKYQATDGTLGAKDNAATIAISENLVAEALYELTSARLKTRVDELHRLVDMLKSIQIGRMQDKKLSNSNIIE